MRELVVTRDNWTLLIDEVHQTKSKDIPDWQCLFVYYNVCLASVITPFSAMVWNLYNRLNGFKSETYESFLRLPAILVDCVQVIQVELNRINDIREKEERQRAGIASRQLKGKHGRR